MASEILSALRGLPPLWTTEARDTEELVLPLRLVCRWHRLAWYPVEVTDDVAFGLTLVTVPQWRHFHLRELMRTYGGFSVRQDPAHVAQPAVLVPEVALHRFDDLTPFVASNPRVD